MSNSQHNPTNFESPIPTAEIPTRIDQFCFIVIAATLNSSTRKLCDVDVVVKKRRKTNNLASH